MRLGRCKVKTVVVTGSRPFFLSIGNHSSKAEDLAAVCLVEDDQISLSDFVPNQLLAVPALNPALTAPLPPRFIQIPVTIVAGEGNASNSSPWNRPLTLPGLYNPNIGLSARFPDNTPILGKHVKGERNYFSLMNSNVIVSPFLFRSVVICFFVTVFIFQPETAL